MQNYKRSLIFCMIMIMIQSAIIHASQKNVVGKAISNHELTHGKQSYITQQKNNVQKTFVIISRKPEKPKATKLKINGNDDWSWKEKF